MRILVTAGPTREPIDAVRVLTNRSSGTMGLAVAREVQARGHELCLLLSQSVSPIPEDLAACTRSFDTTDELRAQLAVEFPAADVLIMAAAVADFIPLPEPPGTKRSRHDGPWDLHLEPAPDLIAELASQRRDQQRIIGFALEPASELEQRARAKLIRKELDAIVANPLETMESNRISGHFITAEGNTWSAPPDVPKPDFAAWLLDRIDGLLRT